MHSSLLEHTVTACRSKVRGRSCRDESVRSSHCEGHIARRLHLSRIHSRLYERNGPSGFSLLCMSCWPRSWCALSLPDSHGKRGKTFINKVCVSLSIVETRPKSSCYATLLQISEFDRRSPSEAACSGLTLQHVTCSC